MNHKHLWPIRCDDTGEIIANYVLYIQSNHWKRIKVLFKHGPHHKGKCYVCGSTEKLELHHKTYEWIGHENMNDLQELCVLCHGFVHQLAMTGKQMGANIENAADAMLGAKDEGTHEYTPGPKVEPSKDEFGIRLGYGKQRHTTLVECRFCRVTFAAAVGRKGAMCPTCKIKRSFLDLRIVQPQAQES